MVRFGGMGFFCFVPLDCCTQGDAPFATSPQLRHWQNKHHDIPSIKIFLHDKYHGRNFQYRPTLLCTLLGAMGHIFRITLSQHQLSMHRSLSFGAAPHRTAALQCIRCEHYCILFSKLSHYAMLY